MVNDIIFKKIYDKLGINVTADELTELAMGENASPYIKQDPQFKNRMGQFDPNQVRMYLANLDNDPQGVEPGTVRRQWMTFETMLKQNQFQQKFNNLITKGLYVPTWMAEMAYNDQNRTVSFKYVALPYNDISDAAVKVTDDDLSAYLKTHANRFKEDDETRKISYVTFDILPSAADTAKTIQYLEDKREEFAKGKTISDDSMFVKLYSETPFDDVYYEKDKLISPVKDSFFIRPIGSVIGPYLDGDMFKLAKISDRKMISDSVRVRDIRFSFTGITTQEAANERIRFIDSIYTQIDSFKKDFGAMAMAYSDDTLSRLRGGDMGWIKQNEKDKAYNDLIFYRAQKGKVYKLPLQSENAIHLIQVIDEKPSKMGVLVSYFSKEIAPSSETEEAIYTTATTFAADNQQPAKFKANGEKLHIKTVNKVTKDAYTIEGLNGNARDIVKWIFEAKKGAVSQVYTVEKKHVVIMLDDIRPKGVPDLDAVRAIITPDVIKEKKFAALSKKIADAKASNIDDLATKLGKTTQQGGPASFANPNVNGAREPSVVATALSTAVGKLSQPVEGNLAVYVVQPTEVQEPAKATDYSMYTAQLKQQLQSKANYAQATEKKLADVQDIRLESGY
jgi:peptidyl-prolyl cis-trans isomerase D